MSTGKRKPKGTHIHVGKEAKGLNTGPGLVQASWKRPFQVLSSQRWCPPSLSVLCGQAQHSTVYGGAIAPDTQWSTHQSRMGRVMEFNSGVKGKRSGSGDAMMVQNQTGAWPHGASRPH